MNRGKFMEKSMKHIQRIADSYLDNNILILNQKPPLMQIFFVPLSS